MHGGPPRALLSRQSSTQGISLQASTGADGNLYFGLPVPGILNSLITLELNADSVNLVQNVAPGTILSAQASLTAGCEEMLVFTELVPVLTKLPEDFCSYRSLTPTATP